MKRKLFISGMAIFTVLLLLVNTGAHTNEEQGHRNSDFDDKGFRTNTEYMEINGSVQITDQGIVFSISMSPNMDTRDMMRGNMGEGMGGQSSSYENPQIPEDFGPNHGSDMENRTDDGNGHNDEGMGNHDGDMDKFRGNMTDMDSYMNGMNVTLFALVEFEDQGLEGYDENDTVLSTYYLNSSSLNPIEFDGNSSYTISSPDGVFKLYLETNNTAAFTWKWSIELVYPFTADTSSIALLHEVNSMNGEIEMRRGNMYNDDFEHMDEHQDNMMNNNTMLNPGNGAGMFFSWIDTAVVDGVETNVTVTRGDVLAISIPQGTNIYYDPSLGVSAELIDEMELTLASVIAESSDMMSNDVSSDTNVSETPFPAIVALVTVLGLTIVITRRRS